MSPVKKTPEEATKKWAKGIGDAKADKAFSKGVAAVGAAGFEKGVKDAGDETWASGTTKGVDAAAAAGRWSMKTVAQARKWATNAGKAEKKWAENTLAKEGEFSEKIAKVITEVGGCLEDIDASAIARMRRELGDPKLSDKQIKALLFQNCMKDQKAAGKFD